MRWILIKILLALVQSTDRTARHVTEMNESQAQESTIQGSGRLFSSLSPSVLAAQSSFTSRL